MIGRMVSAVRPSSIRGKSGSALLLVILSATVLTDVAAQVVSKGDLLFLESNTLLATSPTGVERTKVRLASLKRGPIDIDGFPSTGKRFIEEVFPGSTSEDGRFSFNPVNSNRPINSNKTDDKALLVVTDLTKGKVKHSVQIPSPGLRKGTAFNFQSDYSPPANNGDIETNLGYNARRYVAAGSGDNDKYSIFLIISAWSCKERNSEGLPQKQQLYTGYTYNARTGKLSWSGIRQSLISTCSEEGDDLLEGKSASSGRGLGAAGSVGFFIAGKLPLGGPGDLSMYKLKGKRLESVFNKPGSNGDNAFGKLTLLSASEKTDSVQVVGATDPFSQPDNRPVIGIFGNVGSKRSQLTGFKFERFEYITALAANNGGLYALTRKAGKDNGPLGRTNVVKITPSSSKSPSTKEDVFTLASKYAGSLEVVGTTV